MPFEPFDPQVLRWLEGKSEYNGKGHQFSKAEMKRTKSNSVVSESTSEDAVGRNKLLEAKDEKTESVFLSLKWLFFKTY